MVDMRQQLLMVSLTVLFFCHPRVEGQTVVLRSESKKTIIPPRTVDRLTWSSNAYYQINKQRSYENLVMLFTLVKAYEQNPHLDSATEIVRLNKLRDDYRLKYRDADGQYRLPEDAVQATQSMLTLAGAYGGPYAKAAKPLADELLRWGVRGYESYRKRDKQTEAQRYLSQTNSYSELLGKYIDRAWLLSTENKDFQVALRTHFGPIFNADPEDSAEVIKRKNPDFKLTDDVSSLVTSSEANGASIENLRTTSSSQNRHLIDELGLLRKELSDLNNAKLALGTALSAEEKARNEKELLKAQYEINIEGARSSVYVLSGLANLLRNPTLARDISVTGNSTIQLIEAIQKYNSTIRISKTFLNKAASTATLAATGFSAGLAIAAMIQPGGNTDQLVVEQLNALQQQVTLLRQEMHDRFDRVDLKLNQILDTMGAQFDALVTLLNNQQVQLSEINDATRRIDQGIVALDSGQKGLEIRAAELVKAGVALQFNTELEQCFSPSSPLTRSQLSRCLAIISSEAMDITLDPLVKFHTDDETILSISAMRPISFNYLYMARLGGERFRDNEMQFLGTKIVDPVQWGLGIDEYLGLRQEWVSLGDVNRGRDIALFQAAGEALTRMRKASRQAALYDKLLNNYSTKLVKMRSSLNAAERSYALQNVPGGNSIRKNSKDFVTTTPLTIEHGTLPPCPVPDQNYLSPSKALSLPGGVEALISQRFIEADNLKLAQLQICYEVQNYFINRSTRSEFSAKGITIYRLLQAPVVRVKAFMVDPENSWRVLYAFDREVSAVDPIWWASKGRDETTTHTRTEEGKDPEGTASALWNSELRNRFVSNSTSDFEGSFEHVQVMKAMDAQRLDEIIARYFDLKTNAFYHQLLSSDFKGTREIALASTALTSAKLMLQNFITIGFATELEQDEQLRGSIFGQDAIISGDDIENSFTDVFRLPQAKKEHDARSDLKSLSIDPSKKALQDSIKIGNFRVFLPLLVLGYWDELGPDERLASLADAKAFSDRYNGPTYRLVQEANHNTLRDRNLYQEASMSMKPYEFLEQVADARLASFSNQIKQLVIDDKMPRYPLIDDRLDNLKLYLEFYPTDVSH